MVSLPTLLPPAINALSFPLQEAHSLDVHPPHGATHSIKDFLLHIFTITIGLFIALFL